MRVDCISFNLSRVLSARVFCAFHALFCGCAIVLSVTLDVVGYLACSFDVVQIVPCRSLFYADVLLAGRIIFSHSVRDIAFYSFTNCLFSGN